MKQLKALALLLFMPLQMYGHNVESMLNYCYQHLNTHPPYPAEFVETVQSFAPYAEEAMYLGIENLNPQRQKQAEHLLLLISYIENGQGLMYCPIYPAPSIPRFRLYDYKYVDGYCITPISLWQAVMNLVQ